MFGDNKPNYQKWAVFDQSYSKYEAMTGIYQCYCIKFGKTLSSIFNSDDHVCLQYDWAEQKGGAYTTVLLGISIGILNNIGAYLVIKNIKLVGYHSYQT